MSFNAVVLGEMGDTSVGLLSGGDGSFASASRVAFATTFALARNMGWRELANGLQ